MELDANVFHLASLLDISHDLHTNPTVTNLSVAFYMLAMSIFPLWWSSFSETLGRRTIYIVSFALFLLWNILAAISTNIAMLVITRLLGGGAAASVQAVGAGTIADIWEVRERGKAMGIFYLGPLMGPLFAPILGGVLAQKLGWRSTQWALATYGGFLLVILIFALPETLKDRRPPLEEPTGEAEATPAELKRTASRQVIHQKTKTTIKWLKRAFLDPLKIILYLRFPAVAITVYYAAITFGSLYLLNISLETTFSKPPYNFSTIEVGLTYIPNSIGYILASLFGGRWTDIIMAREAKRAKRYDDKGKLVYRPEDRMRENAWIAAFLYPAALIWYGWTAEKGVIWPVPVGLSSICR
jgi:multidrug resistance protein